MEVQLERPVEEFKELWCYDPGGTTGFARLLINKEEKRIKILEIKNRRNWQEIENDVLEIKELNNLEYVYAYEKDGIKQTRTNHKTINHACVVYEGFQLHKNSPTNGIQLIPVEVIGVLRFLCGKHYVHSFMQMPHERLIGKAPDKVTDIIDLWYPSLLNFPSHYGSALRHGVVFATKHIFNNQIGKLYYDNSMIKEICS